MSRIVGKYDDRDLKLKIKITEAGPQGIDGKDGPAGQDGLPGVDGRDGVDGIDGLPGKDGANGRDGKDGLNGVSNIPGPKGDPGKDGILGKDGDPGKDGEPGPAGKDGKDGEQGIQGEQGLNGEPGKGVDESRISLMEYNNLSSEAENLDANGLYLTVSWRREDMTLYMQSNLLGEGPSYPQVKVEYFAEDGVEAIQSMTWDLTYDANDFIIKQELVA